MDFSRHVNPYIAGSPVTGNEMFFGREDVFSFVRRNLTGRHRDTPIVLYGQRRTGKTSVLYQLHRHLDPRYRCIFIDLHGLNLNGMENLLWGLANFIKRGLQRDHQLRVTIPDRAMFSANPQAAFETSFLDAVEKILGGDHLLLMIDEVVRLHEEVRAGRLERDVFDYLRHLMQHFERLNFVFSLGSGVEEMKKDYAFLFGVALYHRISFLEPVAARALITKPAQGCYEVTPDAIEKILQITSGHPYYTQLVCHCLFDRSLRAPKSQMTSADVDAVLIEAIELGSANLTYVWEDSTPEEQATMAAMAAAITSRGCPATVDQIRKVWRKLGLWLPAGEAASAARNLTAREVVVASDGGYSFTVDLQRLWLDKHRRLDWVKEELGETARKWGQPVKTERSAALDLGKTPVRQPRHTLMKAWIFGGAFAGIVLLVVLIVVLTSSHAPPQPPNPAAFSFKEHFSSRTKNWIVHGADSSGQYTNGRYQIHVKPIQGAYAFASPLSVPRLNPAPQNIAIDVSAGPAVGSPQLLYGIACRSNSSSSNDYELHVAEGYVSIVKYVNYKIKVLDSRDTRTLDVYGINQLRLVCQADGQNAVRLVAWVNGTKLLDVTDGNNPSVYGEVGIVVSHPKNQKKAATVEFDNFVVTQN